LAGKKNKRDAVVSIGAGVSQLAVIKAAKEAGFGVIAVDRDAKAPGMPMADAAVVSSTHDRIYLLKYLEGLEKDWAIRGIVARTSAADALRTALAASRKYGLPGLDEELISISTDKSALRGFCGRRHLPFPARACSARDYPVIVKPTVTIVGKTGIYLCGDERALRFCTDPEVFVEVESFVEGIDVTCLCLAENGTAKALTWLDELVGVDIGGRIKGLGLSIPSVISGTRTETRAFEIIKELVSSFPKAAALLLVSMRITMEGEPMLIEIHSDLGGDLIGDELLPAACTGFDFFSLAVKVATGASIETMTWPFRPAAVFYSEEPPGFTTLLSSDIRSNLIRIPIDGLSKGPRHLEWLDRNMT